MRIFTVILLTFTLSLNAFSQYVRDSFLVGSDMRSFYLHLPNGTAPATPVPVVIAFHGLGDNANNFKGVGFSAIGDTANFIAVYPQGLPMNMIIQTANAWRIGTPFDGTIDDVAFASDLIDTLIARYNVDTTRIFATGFSMGGFMSQRLACELNTKVAAIASHSGLLAESTAGICTSNHVIPMLHLHGTADQTIGYDGGGPFAPFYVYKSAPATAAFWADLNQCDSLPDSTRLADIKADGFTIDRFEFNNCLDSSEVILYRVNGADHQWLFSSSNDISSTAVIWDFFSRHKMGTPGTLTSVAALTTPLQEISIYPNPSAGIFNVDLNVPGNYRVEAFDFTGRLIHETTTRNSITAVDLSTRPTGLYLLRVYDLNSGTVLATRQVSKE